jgi:hypothetical protein
VQCYQFQNFHKSCTPQPAWSIGQPYLYTLWQGVTTSTLFSDSRSHTNVKNIWSSLCQVSWNLKAYPILRFAQWVDIWNKTITCLFYSWRGTFHVITA